MDDLLIRNATIYDGTGSKPFEGSVTVSGGVITSVSKDGASGATAHRVIDATGQMLTPGFVDIHTHYDGQVCWDKELSPSCWHGVTTAIMGNCGVGFAPVRPGSEDKLIELMESVEDIPGTALHEGIHWGWESFAEYLDSIDTPYAMDIGTQVPHVAIRHYVMGERCYDDATGDDMIAMKEITSQALQAGALGFSTSRFFGHVDKQGNPVPGTYASAEEMQTIGEAFSDSPNVTMELISDTIEDPEELQWIEHIARTTGCTMTPVVQPDMKEIWKLSERLKADGFSLRPQVGARPASILMMLGSTINPLMQYEPYWEIMGLSPADQRLKLADPAFRERMRAAEPNHPEHPVADRFMNDHEHQYIVDDELSYEPGPEDSIAAISAANDVKPIEVIMDALAKGNFVLVFFGKYDGDLSPQKSMIENPSSVFGLSDGGAHCGLLVDAGMPTYMMSYFARDRVRGECLPLELVVHKLTQDTAQVYGLNDRGVIAPGYKADLNIIDYDRLKLRSPEISQDLPAGGQRLIQKADGYIMTIKAGVVTYELGEHTGAMPGHLLRTGMPSPTI